jgi:hypothetical protein
MSAEILGRNGATTMPGLARLVANEARIFARRVVGGMDRSPPVLNALGS